MPKYIDIVGNKYGRLQVVSFAYMVKHVAHFNCICDCGKETIKAGWSMRNGTTKSCGCYAKERARDANMSHGYTYTRLYEKYGHMKSRCYNENDSQYKNYGGKGVVLCDEWKDSFENFKDWALSSGYKEGLSIDRIDSDKNYEPSNCQWLTLGENSRKMSEHKRKMIGKTYPAGIQLSGSGRFLTYDKRAKYVGTFDTLEEAVEKRTEQNKRYVNIRG